MNRGARGPVSTPAHRVFICYRREEAAAHAGRLYDAMVARFGERNVFMDIDLAPGVDFVERITEVVTACQVLIVVMGPDWATAKDEEGDVRIADPEDFVRLEVETALRRPDVTPIPVLVAGARMPKRESLPPELQPITRRNALELSEARWRYDVGRLNSTLDDLLASFPTASPPASVDDGADAEEPAAAEAAKPSDQRVPPSTVATGGPVEDKTAAPPRWRQLRWALLGAAGIAAIVVAAVLAAGGGGGGTCDLDQVACVIETASKPTDPADCAKLETQSYLEQTTFRTGSQAIASCRSNALDTANDPDSVDVSSDVQISGDRATAEASFNGGFYDGQTQVLALVKAGGGWKIDRIERFKDFDLQGFIEAFEKTAPYAEEPLTPPQAKCVAGQLGQMEASTVEAAILAGNVGPFASAYEACGIE